MVFWQYKPDCINGEYWVSPEKFEIRKQKLYASINNWVSNNREKVNKRCRDYRNRNIEKCRERCRKYHAVLGKTDKEKKRKRDFYLANKERLNELSRIRCLKKRKKDPIYKMQLNIRWLVNDSMRKNGYTKKSRTQEILGCSWEFFKNYIEQRWKEGMTWENRGKWHLDHIVPISSANTEKEILKLNHYTNFRPLWAFDNISKSNKTNKQLELISSS